MTEYEIRIQKEQARNAEVGGKLLRVAEILHQEVKTEKNESSCRCTVETKELFMTFSAGYEDGRIHVSGVYSRLADGTMYDSLYYTQEEKSERKARGLVNTNYGKIEMPRITVSPEKTAEQIAKDIQRRFLPDYRYYLARLLVVINATDSRAAAIKRNLELLKGSPLTKHEREGSRYVECVNGRSFSVRGYSDCVSIEFNSLTVEQATEMVAIARRI